MSNFTEAERKFLSNAVAYYFSEYIDKIVINKDTPESMISYLSELKEYKESVMSKLVKSYDFHPMVPGGPAIAEVKKEKAKVELKQKQKQKAKSAIEVGSMVKVPSTSNMWICPDGKTYYDFDSVMKLDIPLPVKEVMRLVKAEVDRVQPYVNKFDDLKGMRVKSQYISLVIHDTIRTPCGNILICLQYSYQHGGQLRLVRIYTDFMIYPSIGDVISSSTVDMQIEFALKLRSISGSAKSVINPSRWKDIDKLLGSMLGL